MTIKAKPLPGSLLPFLPASVLYWVGQLLSAGLRNRCVADAGDRDRHNSRSAETGGRRSGAARDCCPVRDRNRLCREAAAASRGLRHPPAVGVAGRLASPTTNASLAREASERG